MDVCKTSGLAGNGESRACFATASASLESSGSPSRGTAEAFHPSPLRLRGSVFSFAKLWPRTMASATPPLRVAESA